MAKTYAAIYLPRTRAPKAKPNEKIMDLIGKKLESAKNKALALFDGEKIKEIAQNMSFEDLTEFTHLYVTGALTHIINNEPITSQKMLDALFNSYAPALNAGLLQCGYNSLNEMRIAAKAGNINVTQFINGFSSGLRTMNDFRYEKFNSRADKFGEEIPIDVVTQIEYVYEMKVAEQKIPEDMRLFDYATDLDPVKISLKANVKNENAELWEINQFNNKIVDAMMQKKLVTCRFGQDIYEDCLITRYKPTITNIYNISFECDITYIHRLNTQTMTYGEYRLMNRTNGPIGDFEQNIIIADSTPVYGGIMLPRSNA